MSNPVLGHFEGFNASGKDDPVATETLDALFQAQSQNTRDASDDFMTFLNHRNVIAGVVVIDDSLKEREIADFNKHRVFSTLEEGIECATREGIAHVYIYGMFIIQGRLTIDLSMFPNGLVLIGYKVTGNGAVSTRLPSNGVIMTTILLKDRIDIIGCGSITIKDMVFICDSGHAAFKLSNNSISTVRNSVIFRSSSFNHELVIGTVTNGKFAIEVTSPLSIQRFLKAAAATGLMGSVAYSIALGIIWKVTGAVTYGPAYWVFGTMALKWKIAFAFGVFGGAGAVVGLALVPLYFAGKYAYEKYKED